MRKPKQTNDITGTKIGKLTVLYKMPKNKLGPTLWFCHCDCGTEKAFTRGNLGVIKSCGCESRKALEVSREKNKLKLEGKIFGKLKVLKFSRMIQYGKRHQGFSFWLCQCECGSQLEVLGTKLSRGLTKACHQCTVIIQIPFGTKFGRWTVLNLVPSTSGKVTKYSCKCECGTISDVQSIGLRTGTSLSCGCLRIEQQKEKARKRREDPNFEYNELQRLKKNNQNLRTRFNTAIHRVARKNLPWNLSFEQYCELLSHPCFYCNKKLNEETGTGLDRINNNPTIGYTPLNVLPCCGTCNNTRADKYTSQEFKIMIMALLKYRNDKKTNS